MEHLRFAYLEICDFFRSCGGSYRDMHSSTCNNIIDALANNRCIIHRDNGNIVRAVAYWRIHEADLAVVQAGKKPVDVETGNIIYLAEHAGTDGNKGLYRLIRDLKGKYQGDACWHERWITGRFVYYRRKR